MDKTIQDLIPDDFEETLLEEGIEVIEEEILPEGIGATYYPRLSAPSILDKNYIHYTKGGYNTCILIKGDSCLPNCVGYAWGRWRELLGATPKLSRANAEMWWGNTVDGYKRGSTPRLGAVCCWRKGKAGVASDGAGHVAIVERINSDGSITLSNSGYGGSRFYLTTLKAPYNIGSEYTHQGFIYLPIEYIDKLVEDGTFGAKSVTALQQFLGTYQDGIISGQSKTSRPYHTALVSVAYGRGGSSCIRALQGYINRQGFNAGKEDGMFGPQTIKAVQQFLNKKLGLSLATDMYFGPKTAQALQKFLNNQL